MDYRIDCGAGIPKNISSDRLHGGRGLASLSVFEFDFLRGRIEPGDAKAADRA